ncbi:GLIPR1-like protein 1 isoform X1 [Silurus asotus]|uniref:GLIPR1-like protein 1 isoform X1 n=1 Tax=Silurus asotus TaxID=30991 RepID=A0AAD5FPJ0_SILAS|nr:GLIPR1-like protein 1 isoform X1 [Silurus asotus]
MASVLHLFLHLVLLLPSLSLSMREKSLPDITHQEFIDICLKEHNEARSNVKPSASNMRYMTWDNGLEVLAKAWAKHCVFTHNQRLTHPVLPSVGENIWAGASHGTFDMKLAIKSWVDEVNAFDYNTLKCTKICGHYTQVVWADTYKVGCAVNLCPDGVKKTTFSHTPGALFVCNYATVGNYLDVHPYKAGVPCSQCGGETCEKNLCKNSTRDHPIPNSWIPDWDPGLRECGVFCKTVLIIRPVSLLMIFGGVFLIQRRCPNIFAYIN